MQTPNTRKRTRYRRKTIFNSLLPYVWLLFWLAVPGLAVAQVNESVAVRNDIADLTKEDVEALRNLVVTNPTFSEEQKGDFLLDLDSILQTLAQAQAFEDQAKVFKAAQETSPRKAQSYNHQLGQLPMAENLSLDSNLTSEQARVALDKEDAILESKDDQLKTLTSALTDLQGRPLQIAERLPTLNEEIADLQKQWDAIVWENRSDDPKTKLDTWKIQSAWISNIRELELIEQEQLSQTVREEELGAQVELLRRELQISRATVRALTNLLATGLREDIDRIKSIAVTTAEKMPSDGKVADLSNEVLEHVEQLERIVEAMRTTAPLSISLKNRIGDLEYEYSSVKEELKFGFGGIEMAQLLYELRRRTSKSSAFKQASVSIEQSRLMWFEAKRSLREQPDIKSRFSGYPSEALKLVEAREEVLEKLETESASLTDAVGTLRADQSKYELLCHDIRQFVATKLFGFEIRSCSGINLKSLTEIPNGLSWLINRSRLEALTQYVSTRQAQLMIVGGIVLILLLLRTLVSRRLSATAVPIRRISTDKYNWTLKAAFLTIVLAIPLPLFWLGFCWDSGSYTQTEPWVAGLASGLIDLAAFVFIAALVYESCRPNGLAQRHFRWNEEFASSLRRKILLVSVSYLPLMLLAHCYLFGEGAEYLPSVGRFLFILAQLWVGYQFLFYPVQNLGIVDDEANSGFWVQIQRPLFVGTSLLLIAVACFGYLITAIQLSIGLFTTAGIILFFELAYRITKRWFDYRRRTLAFSEAIEKRRARMEAAEAEHAGLDSDEVLSLNEEAELGLDLGIARDQSENILRLLFNLIVILTVYRYWSEAIPLTSVLAGFQVAWIPGLSLLQLTKAVVVIVVSTIVIRNLPGLLEFTVLRTSQIEAGTRNAIYTLCQYGVGAISLVVLSNLIQLDWDSVGWMAAALSVGLGFGLQEIVANFVSGIIVLFERPIRVGDVVTLEGDTGTVTRINMRATTVTNWDRQDIIVPNKNLITRTILNWTLSAGLNRIVINVGVGYECDTDKAIQILLDAAADHTNVLEDPAPLASFEQFADSSKNLVLRAYLPNLDNRIRTISELHTDIATRFKEAGIEIPFPQQDLHLRSGWPDGPAN